MIANRMTATEVLTRKLMHGDIQTVREGNRVFIPYDSLRISLTCGGSLRVEVMDGTLVLASIDVPPLSETETYHIDRLEGRLEITGA